jgi:hypothetical protein
MRSGIRSGGENRTPSSLHRQPLLEYPTVHDGVKSPGGVRVRQVQALRGASQDGRKVFFLSIRSDACVGVETLKVGRPNVFIIKFRKNFPAIASHNPSSHSVSGGQEVRARFLAANNVLWIWWIHCEFP